MYFSDFEKWVKHIKKVEGMTPRGNVYIKDPNGTKRPFNASLGEITENGNLIIG